jgi:hypothetical protein
MDSQTSFMTRLESLAPPVTASTNNPLPAPVSLPTSTFFNVGKGNPNAERWEGMLVQLNNVTLTDTMPTFQVAEEFAVNDGSGQIIIRKDGKHRYTQLASEVSQGKILIPLGSRISYLRGIVMFSGNQYKVVPRTAADFGTITGVDLTRTSEVPTVYSLGQNYPNPFNPVSTITFSIPKNEFVSVKVYNLLGQEVETLVNGMQSAGTYTVRFDGSHLGSGVYFYRLQAGPYAETKKMLLVK